MILKPVSFDEANGRTKEIYKEILASFDTKNIPELFRYIANFPDFFDFSWNQIRPLISTDEFKAGTDQLINFSDELINTIFSPSDKMQKYTSNLDDDKFAKLENISSELVSINSKMLVISIAIRESLKGIVVSEQNYLTGKSVFTSSNLIQLDEANSLELIDKELNNLYPDFYSLTSHEIQNLSKKEEYLKARVELERITQMLIESFSNQINFPFQETVEMLRKNSNSEEILLLLNTVFPSNYPHILFAGSLMKNSLKKKNKLITQS